MELEVYKKDGSKSGEMVKLSPDVFGIEPSQHAIYMAVRSYLDNQRQGTHKVKTRAEVRGGGKKPFKQKGTGNARQGTSRSPVMTGGGSIFGPKPRDYSNELPAQMKKLARKSALSAKAKEGQIKVVEDFSFEGPKTKEMAAVLKALQLDSSKTLVLTATGDVNVYKSGRNIPRVQVLRADKASTYDLVNNQVILFQKSAVEVLHNTFKQ
ncbi:MAG: 50S ribosomal protein L4 [Bacteroidetes bacterium]|nr:50S ribosomal protein L4 [Bacteroidota bacterium]MCW5896404.1 50S ribosomal protein L4 [Bacteroidota bacterium]